MVELKPEFAREWMVGHHGLKATFGVGLPAVSRLLPHMRCIQLDPLDRIGTNADLVVLARVDGVRRGAWWPAIYPGGGFEHFAKERCLLPAYAFPYYRAAADSPQPTWWSQDSRVSRLEPRIIDAVLAEVQARGPVTPAELADRGAVRPIDWSGWKGTSKAASMALDLLWLRCQVVTTGRSRNQRWFDVPERALPSTKPAPSAEEFARWALLERVEAAGLLSMASGAHWSTLAKVRTTDLPAQLIREGAVEEVTVAGSSRRYLAPKGFRDREYPSDDGRMRVLGPLDPLIWDRKLVEHVFGFEYVWEVYKPAEKRRWGWYVMPVLHEGRFVSRIEAHAEGGELVVDRRWDERPIDESAFASWRSHHEAAL